MRRMLAVGFAPSVLFVASVWALARTGSFTGRGEWRAAIPRSPDAVVSAGIGVGVSAVLLALLLHPFQVRAVRVLEGYWDRWAVTAGLAGVLAEVQRRRWQALHTRAYAPTADETARQVGNDARRRLAARPQPEVLLPTALGNALRAGELTAGERYGLATLPSWPRLYMQLPDRMSRVLRSARDTLDTAVNLCWSLLSVAAVSAVAVFDEAEAWWLPAAALILAALAYKGAVVAAQAYAGLLHIAYDLHRFDLLRALHYPLPNPAGEQRVFEQVSELFSAGRRPDLPYAHGGAGSDAHDADGTEHAQ